jgi:hypothetical protein
MMRKPRWFAPQVVGLFRKRTDGDWDYFPVGRFGRGYRVRDFDKDEICDGLIQFEFILILALSVVFAAAEISISYIGDGTAGEVARFALSLMALVAVAVLGVWLLHWYVRRLVKSSPLAETRLTAAEEYRLWAARIPKAVILLSAVLGSLGCIGTLIGTWQVLRSGDWWDVPGLLLISAVSGLAGWYYAQVWRHRRG